jgi:hypothetical protein
MAEIQKTIKSFLSNENNLIKMRDILTRHNLKDETEDILEEIIDYLVKGDLDASLIGDYLSEEFDLSPEEGEQISDEMFDEILYEIYDELDENYNIHQKELEEFEKTYLSEEENSEPAVAPEAADEILKQKYQQFGMSSLFQNILAGQAQLAEKYLAGGKITDEISLKNDFYSAINAGDKIKAVGILRIVCQIGGLRQFFSQDQRYMDFFGGFLARHQGAGAQTKFLQDPGQEEFLIEFLKFIFTKRLSFSTDESAMIGVGLGTLCREAGEEEYGDIAYGEESSQSFVWA